MYLTQYEFTLRVHASYWWPDKKNFLWVVMVIIMAAFLLFAPGISQFVSYCQKKKEERCFSEVMYVRNPGE
jgi:hypothetical protein